MQIEWFNDSCISNEGKLFRPCKKHNKMISISCLDLIWAVISTYCNILQAVLQQTNLKFLTSAGSSQHLSLLAQDVLQMMSNICSWNCKHTRQISFNNAENKTVSVTVEQSMSIIKSRASAFLLRDNPVCAALWRETRRQMFWIIFTVKALMNTWI